MDSSWKNLQIRMEAAWNMRTTPKTKRPKTGDIISSAHSLDWNKKKVRHSQRQRNRLASERTCFKERRHLRSRRWDER